MQLFIPQMGLADIIRQSMLANFSDIYCESIFSRHKFPFHFQKFDKGIYIHVFCRASIKRCCEPNFLMIASRNDDSE